MRFDLVNVEVVFISTCVCVAAVAVVQPAAPCKPAQMVQRAGGMLETKERWTRTQERDASDASLH